MQNPIYQRILKNNHFHTTTKLVRVQPNQPTETVKLPNQKKIIEKTKFIK